jgi:hypothetical protein
LSEFTAVSGEDIEISENIDRRRIDGSDGTARCSEDTDFVMIGGVSGGEGQFISVWILTKVPLFRFSVGTCSIELTRQREGTGRSGDKLLLFSPKVSRLWIVRVSDRA